MLTVTDISPRLIDSVNALNVILKDSNKASMLLGIFSLTVWLSPQSSPQWSPFLQNSICSFVSLSVLEYSWVHLSLFEYFWLFFTLSWALSLFGVISALLWHFFGSRNDPFRNWRSTSFSGDLPRMAFTFVSALSVPERKQFFMIFNQASHHEKQRAKRLTKSKTSHIFCVSHLVFTLASL